MKNSINIALTTNWRIQIQNLLADLLLKADDNNKPTSSDKPKVTKVIKQPKPSLDIRPTKQPLDNGDKPGVTKVKVKKKKKDGDEILYDYTFDYEMDMNGYSGDLTIILRYNRKTHPSEFSGVSSTPNIKTLTEHKNDSPDIFGIFESGEPVFDVKVVIPSENPGSVGFQSKTIEFKYIDDLEQLTFGQKVGNFFRRLFRN